MAISCDSSVRMKLKPPCSAEGCQSTLYARGLCKRHYHKLQRYGSPCGGRTSNKGYAAKWIEEVALPHSEDACLNWPFAKNARGYGVYAGGFASRFICRKKHGEPPETGMHAAHKCGNGNNGCVNPLHLYWATPSENAADKAKHDTAIYGQRHPAAKLTESAIIEIRASDLTQTHLARRYGVHQGTISSIILRKSWAHVP